MGRKKKLIINSGIPQHEIEHIARCILPDILAYYESAEGQREFREWQAQREAKEKSKQVTEHGAVSLAAPFLIWPVPPLPHLGSGKAADRKTFWTLFRLGNTITFGCAETHF